MAQPDLTTVGRVKAYLRSPVGAEGDALLETFVKTASRLIRRETRRRFSVPRVVESREFRLYGADSVYVDELRSSVGMLAADAAGAMLAYDADFELAENPDEVKGCTLNFKPFTDSWGGGLSGWGLPPDHASLFITEMRGGYGAGLLPEKVVVTGEFGWDAIPEDISFAATRTCALWFKEEVAHYTDDAFISRGRNFASEVESLPPLTMAVLRGGNWIVESPVILVG